MSTQPELIARTPASGCPACAGKRLHAPEEWRDHHPYAGHGSTREQGYSHPDLEKESTQ
jgi:hypothetical protein